MQVEIRPLKKDDAYISYLWRNNPEIWKYTGSKPDKEITIELELQWIKSVIKKDNEKRFAIIADKVYVGNIQLTNITTDRAEFHIFIGDINYWGKGVASKAMDLLLDYAKEQLKLQYIYLSVHPDNKKGIILYKNKGFEIVGYERISNFIKMKKNLL